MQAWPTINTTVIDKTGLAGIYDFTVRFRSASDLSAATSSSSELPLFTEAIEPQLGLKLQRARGPVDMLVVDSAERPTEN